MPKINIEVDSNEVVLGFPVPKPGRIPCTVGTPKVEQSKQEKPMIVFPLLPLQDIPCTVADEDGEKEVITGQGRPILTYFASLSPGAVRNGSIKRIENACRMPRAIHSGKQVDYDALPQFAGKQVLAMVVNTTGDNGRLQANVTDLFPM